MDLYRKTIAIRIEGIPHEAGYLCREGALFYYGHEPSPMAMGYGPERVLTKIPDAIDGRVDLQAGRFELSAATFTLSATESVCTRLMVNGATAGDPPATLYQAASDTAGTIYVESNDTIAVGDHIYIGNETIRVADIQSVTGAQYVLTANRGIANSPQEDHGAGAPVYFVPPSLKYRQVELILFDLDAQTIKTIWNGLVTGVGTNDQQTAINIKAAETLSVLWGSEGGQSTSSLSLSGGATWYSDGACDAYIDGADVQDWPGDNAVNSHGLKLHNVRIGDVAYAGHMTDDGDQLDVYATTPLFLTSPDVDANDDGTRGSETIDEDVSTFLGWSRMGYDGPVVNDFDGVYGISDTAAHPAAVALALMLSTGAGGNDLTTTEGTTYTFDRLSRSYGMGIPAKLIDADSWIGTIDQTGLSIDRILLGWDGRFSFKDVIFKRLLLAFNLLPFPTSEGKVGLKHLGSWSIDDITEVTDNGAIVHLNPDTIRFDRQLEKYSSVIKAKLGGTGPDEKADEIRDVIDDGLRRNSGLGQSPFEFDLEYRDKDAYRRHGQESDVGIWLHNEAVKRRDNPPLLSCSIPFASNRGAEQLPPLGSWVALRGGPEGGLIGPEGKRVNPDETNIIFIGILVGSTLDLASFDVDCRVLLTNWWTLDKVPRLVAPAAKITNFAGSTNTVTIAQDLPDKRGQSGFLPYDDVQIIHANGRKWYGDPGNLSILPGGVDDTGATWTLDVANLYTVSPSISDTDDLYVVLAGFDDYANADWSGAAGYSDYAVSSRRYAYLADSASKLGAADDPADIYS